MKKQMTKINNAKWVKPQVKTIVYVDLVLAVTLSACFKFGAYPCPKNVR